MSGSAVGRMETMAKAIEVKGGDAEVDAQLERLQKILAAAGIASRRKAEEIIHDRSALFRGISRRFEAGR